MNIKKRLLLLVLFIVAVIAISKGCSYVSEEISQHKLLSYLEDKYHQEFEVEHFKKGATVLSNMYGKDKIFAHPKGNDEIVFEAEEDRHKANNYFDDYLVAKWADELEKQYTKEFNEIMGEGVLFNISLYGKFDEYTTKNVDLNVNQLLDKLNNDVDVVFVVGISTDGEPNLDDYVNRIYKLYNFIERIGTKRYGLSIGFVDKSNDLNHYIRTSRVNNIGWENLDAKVYGYMGFTQSVNPKSPQKGINERFIIKSPSNIKEHYGKIGE